MYKNIFIIVCLLTASAFPWEFIGPEDSLEITNLYCFGGGHILAFVGETPDDNPLLFRSRDYGDTWDSITDCGLPRASTVNFQIFSYENKLYCGPNMRSLYFSEDSGNTWIKDSAIHCGGAMAYSFAAKDSILLVGTYDCFSRSTDYGKTYKDYILIPGLEHDIGAVFCLMAFRDVVYAGTQYGIFASKDWGLTWEKRGKNMTQQGGWITSMDLIDTVIIMSNYAGAYRAYDLGQNENSWIYSFETDGPTFFHIVDSSQIYLAFYNSNSWHFYFSSDTGKTYQEFSVTNPEMYCYKIDNDDKYVYIAGLGGIYRNLKTDSPTGVIEKKKKNNKIVLSFVNNNLLHYYLPEPSYIEIFLYKTNGQTVIRHEGRHDRPGMFTINLKKYDLSSGFYFCLIKTRYYNTLNKIAIP